MTDAVAFIYRLVLKRGHTCSVPNNQRFGNTYIVFIFSIEDFIAPNTAILEPQ